MSSLFFVFRQYKRALFYLKVNLDRIFQLFAEVLYLEDVDWGIDKAAQNYGVDMAGWLGRRPTREQVLATVKAERLRVEVLATVKAERLRVEVLEKASLLEKDQLTVPSLEEIARILIGNAKTDKS